MRAWLRLDGLVLPTAVLLLVSLGLRLALVTRGGQFYWPDEVRYQASRDFVAAVAAGDRAAATAALSGSDHPLFKVIGVIPAAVEFLQGGDPRIPAVFFATFSVLNILLLVVIARRLGGSPLEALTAGALMAASATMFYFARHLLPYDVAMTFGLLAILLGTGTGHVASLLCGAFAGATFFAYGGYWTLGGAACTFHVLAAPTAPNVLRRAGWSTLGLGMVLAAVLAMNALVGGQLTERLLAFSGTVTQGAFEEGWILPFAYLWHAEHLLLVVWLGAVAVCLLDWRWTLQNPRARAAVAAAVFIFSALLVLSVGFNVFVVYGRLARQLVPFFCLTTAAVLIGWLNRAPRLLRPAVAVLGLVIAIQAALNFRTPLGQWFPEQFVERAQTLAADAGAPSVVALYAQHLYPPVQQQSPPAHRELDAAPHPLQFYPYQYEGFNPRKRRFLRSWDIRMRLLIPD